MSVGALVSPIGRVVLMCAGSTVSTVCYAVTIRAGLGLGPLYVLQDGLARHAGIAIGSSVMVTGFALVAVAVCLRSWPGPGTLAAPVLSGFTLDALLPHLPALHGPVLAFTAVVVATWVMALGAAMMIRASVGIAAYDAVMLGLARVLRRPLAPTRLAMETTALAVGWVLGGTVGVGTAVTGILIGPAIAFWLRIVGRGGAPSGGLRSRCRPWRRARDGRACRPAGGADRGRRGSARRPVTASSRRAATSRRPAAASGRS